MKKPTFLAKFYESPTDRFEMVIEVEAPTQAEAIARVYQDYPQATELRVRQMTNEELYE
jgi:predicted phosphoribosyltransferase